MPLWEHCKLVRRTLSKRFYPNVIRNLECLSKTDFVVLPTLSLFVVRFFFSRILFLRTHTTALTYSINLEMGKRGIEPPTFTTWERIYSPPQHRQLLPLPRNARTPHSISLYTTALRIQHQISSAPLEHQESNPGLSGYKPEALPLSYVPSMAGDGFEPPVSRLWALRDNHFSTLQ